MCVRVCVCARARKRVLTDSKYVNLYTLWLAHLSASTDSRPLSIP